MQLSESNIACHGMVGKMVDSRPLPTIMGYGGVNSEKLDHNDHSYHRRESFMVGMAQQ